MSQIVLYFQHSTSVLSFYIDVVLTLSIRKILVNQSEVSIPELFCVSPWIYNMYLKNCSNRVYFAGLVVNYGISNTIVLDIP